MDLQTGKMKIAVGPWGGQGGTTWDDGWYQGVREIKLVYDRCIDSISVVGGNKVAQIKLNYPEEYIISVTGHYSPVVHGWSPVIRSLTFKTNQRSFGPFGVEEGTPFSFQMEGGKIVGFRGRSGWYLDAIGFYLARVQSKTITQRVQRWLQKSLDSKNTRENHVSLKALAGVR